mmetsp:Transcript_39032/g.28869  ORF Transcript_39032/g.28869 Transcript_39032/m.28869 type:complete len:80 (-) Transcript_39032:19-258(-)
MLDEKGKLSTVEDMEVGRQYFTLCSDHENEFVYVIGGYNHEAGVLKSMEKFVVKARKWAKQRMEEINVGRINASACKVG